MDNALSALIYRQHFNPWVAAAQGMGVFAGQVAGHLHDKQAEDQKRAQQKKKNVMTVGSGTLAQAAPDDTLYFAMGTDALGGNPDFNIDAPTLSDYDDGMSMEPNESEMENYGYGDVRRSGCRFWGQPAAKKGNTASIPRQYAQKAVVNESLGANAHAHVAFKHRMSQHLVQDKSDKGAQALYLMWLTQNDPSVLEHEMFTPNMNVSLEHSNPSQSESWFTYFLHIQEAEIHGAAQEIRGFLEHPIDTLLDMDYSISHAILHPIDTYHGIVAKYHWFMQASDMERANAFGHMIGAAMLPIPGVGALKEAAEIARVTRIAASGAEIGRVASVSVTSVSVGKGAARTPRFFKADKGIESSVSYLAARRAYLNAKFGRVANLHTDITLRGYMEQAEKLDVSTASDTAVFYSGDGNKGIAEEFSRTFGKTTLEMTPGGRFLDNQHIHLILPRELSIKPWLRLSERYAQSAFGETYTFIRGARATGVFNTVELPALLKNPNVTDIFERETPYLYETGRVGYAP